MNSTFSNSMRLIIVRHGETLENRNKITQGQSNTQLTAKGFEQAKKVSQRLRNEKIDIAFSSDLDRASDTCKEILKFHNNAKMVKTPILREQANGIFEGKTREEKRKILVSDDTPFYEWCPEGGESWVDVWNRVIPFFNKIKKEYSVETVLFSTHGRPIRCILSDLQNKHIETAKDYVLKNTTVSIINIDGEEVEFEALNCIRHLY